MALLLYLESRRGVFVNLLHRGRAGTRLRPGGRLAGLSNRREIGFSPGGDPRPHFLPVGGGGDRSHRPLPILAKRGPLCDVLAVLAGAGWEVFGEKPFVGG